MALVPITAGVDWRTVLVDTSGNPLGVSGNAIVTTTAGGGAGSNQVQGTAATGAALSGNPVRIGMSDTALAQDILSANAATGVSGNAAGVLGSALMGWHSPNYTRVDSGALIGLDGWVNGHELLMVASLGGVYNGATADRMRAANTAAGTNGTGLLGAGGLVFDATNWQKMAGDTSGRLYVTGPAAVGTAAAGGPVLVGVADNSGNMQNLSQVNLRDNTGSVAGVVGVGIMLRGGATTAAWAGTSPAAQGDTGGRNMGVTPNNYNGATYDAPRNNVDVILLTSAARTTTQTSADIVSYNCRGIVVAFDVTSAGTGSVTLTINYKDPASGKYILLLSGLAVVANGTMRYVIHPEMLDKANVNAQDVIGRVLQIVTTANNANSVTYSVGYTLLC